MDRVIISSFLPTQAVSQTAQGFVAYSTSDSPLDITGGALFYTKPQARSLLQGDNVLLASVDQTSLPDIAPNLPQLELDVVNAYWLSRLNQQAEIARRDDHFRRCSAQLKLPRVALGVVGRPDLPYKSRLAIGSYRRVIMKEKEIAEMDCFFALVSDPRDLPRVYRAHGNIPVKTRQFIVSKQSELFKGPRQPTVYLTGLLAWQFTIGLEYCDYLAQKAQLQQQLASIRSFWDYFDRTDTYP